MSYVRYASTIVYSAGFVSYLTDSMGVDYVDTNRYTGRQTDLRIAAVLIDFTSWHNQPSQICVTFSERWKVWTNGPLYGGMYDYAQALYENCYPLYVVH